jgi:hypothetical protein
MHAKNAVKSKTTSYSLTNPIYKIFVDPYKNRHAWVNIKNENGQCMANWGNHIYLRDCNNSNVYQNFKIYNSGNIFYLYNYANQMITTYSSYTYMYRNYRANSNYYSFQFKKVGKNKFTMSSRAIGNRCFYTSGQNSMLYNNKRCDNRNKKFVFTFHPIPGPARDHVYNIAKNKKHIRTYSYNMCLSLNKDPQSKVRTSFCDTNDDLQKFTFTRIGYYMYTVESIGLPGYFLTGDTNQQLKFKKIKDGKLTPSQIFAFRSSKYGSGTHFRFSSYGINTGSTTWGSYYQNSSSPENLINYTFPSYSSPWYYVLSPWNYNKTYNIKLYGLPYFVDILIRVYTKGRCLSVSKNGQLSYRICNKRDESQHFRLKPEKNKLIIESKRSKMAIDIISHKNRFDNGKISMKKADEFKKTQKFYVYKYTSSYYMFGSIYGKCLRFDKNIPREISCYKNDNKQWISFILIRPYKSVDIPLGKWINIRKGNKCLTALKNNKLSTRNCKRMNTRQLWRANGNTYGNAYRFYNRGASKYIYTSGSSVYMSSSSTYFNMLKNKQGYSIQANYRCITYKGTYYSKYQNCVKDENQRWQISYPKNVKKPNVPIESNVMIKNEYSGKCLQACPSTTCRINQYPCNTMNEFQHWQLMINHDNTFYIRSRQYPDRVMRRYSSYMSPGKKEDSTFAMNIEKVKSGSFNIKLGDNYCLDTTKTKSNTYARYNIKCNPKLVSQIWSFPKVQNYKIPPREVQHKWLMIKDPSKKWCLQSFQNSYVRSRVCNSKEKKQHWKLVFDKISGRVYMKNRGNNYYMSAYTSDRYIRSLRKGATRENRFVVEKKDNKYTIRCTNGHYVTFLRSNNGAAYSFNKPQTGKWQSYMIIENAEQKAIEDYTPKFENNVLGTIRSSSGMCLQKSGTAVKFAKCINNSYNVKSSQLFKFVKNGDGSSIVSSDNSYLETTSTLDNRSKYKFSKSYKGKKIDLSKASKFHEENLKRNNFKLIHKANKKNYCLTTPFGRNLVDVPCQKGRAIQKFMFIRQGLSPESKKEKNKKYQKRNKINVDKYNEIHSLSGQCASEDKSGEPISLHSCGETKSKFIFKITKQSSGYYYIETMQGNSVDVKNNSIFSNTDGTMKNFTITKYNRSYIIKAPNNKCLSTKEETKNVTSVKNGKKVAEKKKVRVFSLKKCSISDISQAFVIIGYDKY